MKMLKQYRWFLALFLFLLFSVCLLEQTKTRTPKESYSVMLDAAVRAETAFAAIREERLARGLPISPSDDPNQTGIIGESYTGITTTLGSLESKRSAANPNTAAMLADMLVQCGVKSGDPVAVNLSSSFPGLNTAVLCALDAIGARGIIISSIGTSTYGANLPEYTWIDMEQVLWDHKLITNRSQWFSLGGTDDIGKEMPEETKAAIIERLTGYGLEFLYYENLNENIEVRRKIYSREGTAVCFINVGGNLLSFGGGPEMVSAESGILLPGTPDSGASARKLPERPFPAFSADTGEEQQGLIPLYLADGIPVIHLLNLRTLLPAWGLPFDPSPLPAAGEGDVYTGWQYNLPLAAGLLLLSLVLFYQAVRSRPRRKIPL